MVALISLNMERNYRFTGGVRPRKGRKMTTSEKIKQQVKRQMRIIRQGAVNLVGEEELAVKLENSILTGKPLIVKFGMDPSAPDIHIGHAVVLRKLKQLQDMGHTIVIIIGDFTAKIGDPTGKSKGVKL